MKRALFCLFVLAFIITAAYPVPKTRNWTFAEIEKTGLREKCQEVANLKAENLVTKADSIWEKFKKGNPNLFEYVFQQKAQWIKHAIILPGAWTPILNVQNYSDDIVLCPVEDAACSEQEHMSDYGADAKGHLHLRYSDFKQVFKEKDKLAFEQAAHDKMPVTNIQITAGGNGDLSLFELVGCEVQTRPGIYYVMMDFKIPKAGR